MPANAMGRRATVVIPPSTKTKNDAASTEAGADFKSIMKETSEPAKVKRADQVARSERAEGSSRSQEERSQDQVTATEEAGASPSEDVASSADVAAAESAGDGEGGSESEGEGTFSELLTEPMLSDEVFSLAAEGTPEIIQSVLSAASIPKEQLPDSPETSDPLPEPTGEVAPILEPSSVDGTGLAAVPVASTEVAAPEAVVAAQRGTKGARQKVTAPVRVELQGRGPVGVDVNPALPGKEAALPTEEGHLAEAEVLKLVSEGLDERLTEARPTSTAPRARAAAAPGLAMTAQVSMDSAPQQASRIPTGLESIDLGAVEQDPLEGSVKVNSVRGARIAVPMDDGTLLRGRLDLVDDALDVAIRASEDMGLRADQRVGELREALAERGIDLGEFDVSADADQNEAAGEGEDGTGAEASTGSSVPKMMHEILATLAC